MSKLLNNKTHNKKVKIVKKLESFTPLGFFKNNDYFSMFYKSSLSLNDIYLINNKNGDINNFSLKNKEKINIKNGLFGKNIDLEKINNITYSEINNTKIITFFYIDTKTKEKKLYLAVNKGKDNTNWKINNTFMEIKESAGVISDYIFDKKIYMYYGDSNISTAFSSNLGKWYKDKDSVLKKRPGFFDNNNLKFLGTKIIDRGILVFYDSSYKVNKSLKIQIGLAMFSLNDPNKIIWRSDDAIFENEIPFENDFESKGMVFDNDQFTIYWHSKKTGILSATLNLPFTNNLDSKLFQKLEKHDNNPIISPDSFENINNVSKNEIKKWTANGTFNPTAINLGEKIHLLFRAVGEDGISRIGYSDSLDGFNFDDTHCKPVFYLKRSHFGRGHMKDKYDPVLYESGGSWGGCEDPRVTKIDDRIYMIFNAFDGWDFIRVAYTSIKEKDFLNNNWDWDKPRLISPQGEINKNWVIFPEKINGKFAILHSLTPNIQIDYINRLEDLESGKAKIKSKYERKLKSKSWDTWIRGVGPSPLKTEDGWLVFYHAVTADETHKYKLGVLLLDLNDPTRIIARATAPILTPDMWYENDSKPGIVYACGAIIKGDSLYIYYGGGDKHVCVATASLKEFINNLKNSKDQTPSIKKVKFS